MPRQAHAPPYKHHSADAKTLSKKHAAATHGHDGHTSPATQLRTESKRLLRKNRVARQRPVHRQTDAATRSLRATTHRDPDRLTCPDHSEHQAEDQQQEAAPQQSARQSKQTFALRTPGAAITLAALCLCEKAWRRTAAQEAADAGGTPWRQPALLCTEGGRPCRARRWTSPLE